MRNGRNRHSCSDQKLELAQGDPGPRIPRGHEAEEIVRAIGSGEVDAVVVLDAAEERVVSLASFGTVSELNEVVRAIRNGEVDALVVNEDGSDRVYTLAAMRQAMGESEDRFRQLAESMPGIVFSATADGRPDYFNQAWWTFTEFAPAQAASFDLARVIDAAQRDQFRSAWNECVVNGSCFEMEVQFNGDSGRVPCWHLVRAVPVRDAAGNVHRWFGTCTDIDRMKRSEQEINSHRAALLGEVSTRTQQLEESQNQLRLSQRMAVLGTLAAGVAHDISNLLFPMLTYLDSLKGRNLPAPASTEVESVVVCTQHLRRLVGSLRVFAVDPFQAVRGQRTSLDPWCQEVQPLLAFAVARNVELRCEVAAGLPAVGIGSVPLAQAVFNLVLNASHAMGDQKNGVIQVWAKKGDDPATVLVGVTDNGPGMDAPTKLHCLEPFFTTKAGTQSTGLGLALVNQIVHQAAGEVQITSSPGAGTTFTLKLPAAIDETAADSTEPSVAPARRRRQPAGRSASV